MKKKLLIAGSAIVGLLIVVVAGLWLFLDANQFRPQLENAMGGALGRKVSIGSIKIALLSGGMAIENLSIADDPAFGTEPFVTAKAVKVGVDLIPLIISRSLHVQSFRLEDPQVMLLNSSSGLWNFSGLSNASGGSAAGGSAAGGSAAAMNVVVQRFEIANGRILVGTRGVPGKERVYENVNLEVSDLSVASQFPFRMTAKTPGGGTVTLDGKVGPLSATDAADTPFQVTADVSHLDVASTGFVDPASGLAGLIGFKGTLASDAGRLTSKGTVNATGVQLVPGGAPARIPVEIDYESDYNRKAQTGVVKQGDVHIGKAVAHLTGDYTAGGEAVAVRLKLNGDKMPAPDLEATFPAIGITLPPGASLTRGTLDIALTLTGPVDRLVIAGPINLADATIAGFDLGGKLAALSSFSGGLKGLESTGGAEGAKGAKGDVTLVQTLAATLRVAADGIRADNMNLVAPAFGTLTGSGTIAPKGNLDFTMLAKLTGSGAAHVSRVASLGQPASGIPFRIQGTTANPIFVPDVSHAVSNAVSGLVKNPEAAKKAAGDLGSLFGRKKR
jgi:AsmA protein